MTPELLAEIVGCTVEKANLFVESLGYGMDTYAINTPVRQAAFLAQIGHESESFEFTSEIWGPTSWQVRYENDEELGNIYPGDGYKFRGRGLIQITGRDNYIACADALCLNCVEEPDILSQPNYAALASCWWWSTHGCNHLADQNQFDRITRVINGGLDGYDDRRDRWIRAKKALGL